MASQIATLMIFNGDTSLMKYVFIDVTSLSVVNLHMLCNHIATVTSTISSINGIVFLIA